MSDSTSALFSATQRSGWIRLRTLIVLRWFAIAGQIGAIFIARRVFDVQLELGLCYLVIGAAVIANLVATFIYPETKRLTDRQSFALLLFDICQLSALIYLTGGLNNPFALLIMAPVTVSATVLTMRSTLLLGIVALAAITCVAAFHLPLQTSEGEIYELPALFLFGFWLAIVIGTVFLGIYARRVTGEIHSMSQALLATQMALAREQKLTDLGGVVAAAAHELGTPLATIKLVSTEMMDELEEGTHLKEDAELIREQADRCREILRSMGRAGKDDKHLKRAPLETVIHEAAEPHLDRGKDISFALVSDEAPGAQPMVMRYPEFVHGIRNLVQNAVDFADSRVWVEIGWSDDAITVRILDNGPGFPAQLIGRIGDPFVRRRASATETAKRPEYEGMGLGLFIAKTLLERTGAELSFANGSDPFLEESERPEKSGAIVQVRWARSALEGKPEDWTGPLGENQQFA
ncbi:sensor histidine kinase RegB [Pseudoruegeria sp. SHC-113]|uniref:sensor histidine kinase RegB n=1 Tax=Pseudoruegeria sp. SHC-113 TaxID=2855439 RepID=UPI0021BA4822|nr:ActS/PrrB/RegB family redox-sensitive histidine kinase [Pseudoruegeria sp. SHC-113]MCT8158602.1 ActS/PrrB/RegB family redox-sensitive histidine kinase [Pseudoruegeria sp. SHC-113]